MGMRRLLSIACALMAIILAIAAAASATAPGAILDQNHQSDGAPGVGVYNGLSAQFTAGVTGSLTDVVFYLVNFEFDGASVGAGPFSVQLIDNDGHVLATTSMTVPPQEMCTCGRCRRSTSAFQRRAESWPDVNTGS